jgi:hypothetical protein
MIKIISVVAGNISRAKTMPMNKDNEPEQMPDDAKTAKPPSETPIELIDFNKMSAVQVRQRQTKQYYGSMIARAILAKAFSANERPPQLDNQMAYQLFRELQLVCAWFETDEAATKRGTAKKNVGRLSDMGSDLEDLVRRIKDLPEHIKRYLGVGEIANFKQDMGDERALQETFSKIRSKGESATDRRIGTYAAIYQEFTGRKPGLAGESETGPFVRFVEASDAQFGIRPPKVPTINAALGKWRKAMPKRKDEKEWRKETPEWKKEMPKRFLGLLNKDAARKRP